MTGHRFDVYQLDRSGRFRRRVALRAPDRGAAVALAADLVSLFSPGRSARVAPPRERRSPRQRRIPA